MLHPRAQVRQGERSMATSKRVADPDGQENISILRDAAQLQIQLRHYDALEDTRLQLLRLRPNLRLGWIGLAVAYHLNGKPGEARKVMEQYLTTLKVSPCVVSGSRWADHLGGFRRASQTTTPTSQNFFSGMSR